MSANLIGLGADLQQKLDAMDQKLRRARWAGYVAEKLYRVAQKLHTIDVQVSQGMDTHADNRAEKRLMDQARVAVAELGHGVEVIRQRVPVGWPLYVVFPADVPRGSGIEANYEQGIAVPPRP